MRALRLIVLTIATALVLVPTLARAQQQIELHDATRLSIKHSWLGVAPPTKASLVPVTVTVLPSSAAGPSEPPRIARALPPVVHAVVPVALPAPEPVRGPPASAV